MRPALAVFLVLLGAPAAAQPRRGEPEAGAVHPLAARIEQLAFSLSKGRRSAPPAPRLDARLGLAAQDLARLAPDEGLPPGSAIIAEALSLHGLVEPSPYLLLSTYTVGQEQALLDGLAGPLGEALARTRWRRLGVGVFPLSESRARVMVLLQESYIDLEPLPRWAPLVEEPLVVRGALLPPYENPQVLVTSPRGQVERLPGVVQERRFEATFRCVRRGRYQIEVLGEDSRGSAVLANFPLHCGQRPPQRLLAQSEAPDPGFRDREDAEQQLFTMLNGDRARFGLPALQLDPRLSAVARAHSADMRAGNYLGHVSPRTGNASDRVKRAGIDSVVLLENLARAYSPREAQRGLMDSPGHRANILERSVTHAGIGVEVAPAPGGGRELFVTQLLMKPPAPFDAQKAPQQALERVQELRRKEGAGPLSEDAQLAALAEAAARGVAEGRLTPDRVGEPAQEAMARFVGRYRVLRTVLALTGDISRMTASPAFLDKDASHVGVGVAPANKGAYVVVVLASKK